MLAPTSRVSGDVTTQIGVFQDKPRVKLQKSVQKTKIGPIKMAGQTLFVLTT